MARNYWFYERQEGDPEVRPLTMRALMNLDVVYLKDTDLVLDAMRVMREKKVRHLPIVSEQKGRLVGLVSETDILKNVLHGKRLTREEEYHATLDVMLELKHIMVTKVTTLSPEAPVEDAVELFLNRRIRSVPIVTEGGELVGIVTETDLMKLLKHVVEN